MKKGMICCFVMAAICTGMISNLLFKIIEEKIVNICVLLVYFSIFLLIFISSYGIMKKVNIKYNMWGVAEGTDVLIMISSLLIGISKTNDNVKDICFITFVISFVCFFILSGIGYRMEQQKKRI